MNDSNQDNWHHTSRKLFFRVVIIFAVLFFLGMGIRIGKSLKLRYQTENNAILNVQMIKAPEASQTFKLVLPANVIAWHQATIYARTNGYVSQWFVDFGSRVKEGELLASISAPEVDAQLRQTEADLKTAEANYQIAKITADRYRRLVKTDSVSIQDTEEKISDEKAKAAIVASTTATRDRLRELVGFQRVIAPFDGIISSRRTDIGRLINAGSGTGNIPLFQIVQSNRLRVYVKIPQNYLSYIKPNMTAKLYFIENPGKLFTAKLLDTANAIDPKTRTLLAQFMIDNPDYALMPGSYTEVHLILPSIATMVKLPVNTLLFRAQGLQVATINKDNKVVLRSVTINRDFGDQVEISNGVTPGEAVVLNPSDSIEEGEKVRVVGQGSHED